MVNIFDLHADIGYDMYLKHLQSVENPFVSHRKKLEAGGVKYFAAACFFRGNETWEEMQATVSFVEEELRRSNVVLITGCGHPAGESMYAFMAVEGMGPIHDDAASKVQWLFDHGVRMASLTWNEENSLATGTDGDVCRGITKMGQEVLAKMDELGMILDVSHLNEMSFWDAIRLYPGKLLASHSNARQLCYHERNLTNQQIRAIACRGGIIGVNAIRRFVSCNPQKQNAYHMALHAKHIADIAGIQSVAIGFDYLDYYDDVQDAMVRDLPDASYSQNFIEALRKVGFGEDDVSKIAHRNVINFIHKPVNR